MVKAVFNAELVAACDKDNCLFFFPAEINGELLPAALYLTGYYHRICGEQFLKTFFIPYTRNDNKITAFGRSVT